MSETIRVGDRVQIIGRSAFSRRRGLVIAIEAGFLPVRVHLDGEQRLLGFAEEEVAHVTHEVH